MKTNTRFRNWPFFLICLLFSGAFAFGEDLADIKTKAENGDAMEQCKLGFAYHNGQGVVKDEKEAVKWFHKSAEQGYAVAQGFLGVCYYKGEGTIKDEQEAVKWFHKSAEQGYMLAQGFLGLCYLKGKGVPKDEIEAEKWLLKAAEQGDPGAQGYLGKIYADSIGRVGGIGPIGEARDKFESSKYVRAHAWFNVASAGGNQEAKTAMESLMTADQIAEATKLAREIDAKIKK